MHQPLLLEYHLYGPLDHEMVIPDPHLGPPKGSQRGHNRSSRVQIDRSIDQLIGLGPFQTHSETVPDPKSSIEVDQPL